MEYFGTAKKRNFLPTKNRDIESTRVGMYSAIIWFVNVPFRNVVFALLSDTLVFAMFRKKTSPMPYL